jgi:hypothetical protein
VRCDVSSKSRKATPHSACAATAMLFSLLMLFAVACTEISSARGPTGSEHFDAPPVYARWWKMVETCSGVSGSLPAVSWYVLPNATSIPSVGEFVGGYWQEEGNQIVLIGEAQMAGPIVRHEMLHALLKDATHQRRFFLERCGGVLECTGQCIVDAGPAPSLPPGTQYVVPDSLTIGVEIDPLVPRSDSLGGYFTITVLAENTASHPVVLYSPPDGDSPPIFTFGYIFGSSGVGLGFFDHAWDTEAAVFGPGETKREIFDFAIGNAPGAVDLAPGAYVMRFGYGTHLTDPISITIGP